MVVRKRGAMLCVCMALIPCSLSEIMECIVIRGTPPSCCAASTTVTEETSLKGTSCLKEVCKSHQHKKATLISAWKTRIKTHLSPGLMFPLNLLWVLAAWP